MVASNDNFRIKVQRIKWIKAGLKVYSNSQLNFTTYKIIHSQEIPFFL